MKATFLVGKEINIIEQLESIAEKYGSSIQLDDDGTSHFLLIKPRLKIMKRVQQENYLLEIAGAKVEDINYFKSFWGEPNSTLEEKLTPQEFAIELISIPSVNEKSKEELITIMGIDERTFTQYSRLLDRFKGRPNAPDEIAKAIEIFQNLS